MVASNVVIMFPLVLIASLILLQSHVNGDSYKDNQILRRHEQYRNIVNSSKLVELKWDEELAGKAKQLVSKCPLSVDDLPADKSLSQYGINIGTQKIIDGKEKNLISIVDTWGLQRSYYVYPSTCDGGNCDNWIQMIYEKTTKIGCGYEVCKDDQVLCCLYVEKAAPPSPANENEEEKPVPCDPGYTECNDGCCKEEKLIASVSSKRDSIAPSMSTMFYTTTTTSSNYEKSANLLLVTLLVTSLLLAFQYPL